jgi:hypothetical protein
MNVELPVLWRDSGFFDLGFWLGAGGRRLRYHRTYVGTADRSGDAGLLIGFIGTTGLAA